MPGNLQNAAPTGVMPYALCTTFVESRDFVQLQAQYHDGTTERAHQGGVVPFLFYNLAERSYDSTANSTLGRYTGTFQGRLDPHLVASPEAIRRAWRDLG
jgi:hypothetical protein